jgi:uncharacterized protein YndB with AHSA1/START domain
MFNPIPDVTASLTVKRTFAASRERVFRAWTEPQALEQWFRPMGMTLNVTDLSLYIGGGFAFTLTELDGTQSFVSGKYLEIIPPEKLVFTWKSTQTNDEETLVTVMFAERDLGSTEVILKHERLADNAMVTLHSGGWGACMDILSALLVQEN